MSKIGKRPISFTSAKIEVMGNHIEISGPKGKLSHDLPDCLSAELKGKSLVISLKEEDRKSNMLWGLHRALLANKIKGVEAGFELNLKIVGLGFKAQLTGKKLVFSLGYSHKIDYELPSGIDVVVDKTGQMLNFKSIDKFLLGKTCDVIRSLRPPEPYKGTGIMRENEVIRRKAGKSKGAAK